MYSQIYWLTRLDSIIGLLATISVLSIIATIMIAISLSVEEEWAGDYGKKKRRWFKRALITSIIVGVITVFIPSQNDMILIYAGGKTYDYINSDTSLQKIPYKASEYLRAVLDAKIKEAKESK